MSADDKKMVWNSYQLLTSRDDGNRLTLSVLLECGYKLESGKYDFYQNRISFVINSSDSKGKKLKYSFQYQDAVDFVKKYESYDNVFDQKAEINLSKHYSNNKVVFEMMFRKVKEGDEIIKMASLSIKDDVNAIMFNKMLVSGEVAVGIYEVCKQFCNNYISAILATDMNYRKMIQYESIINLLSIGSSKVLLEHNEPEIVELKEIPSNLSISKDMFDVDNFDSEIRSIVEKIPGSNMEINVKPSVLPEGFEISDNKYEKAKEILDNPSNIQIKESNVSDKKKFTTKFGQHPIIKNAFKYDPNEIGRYVTKFTLSSEKTDEKIFCPLDYMISLSDMDNSVYELLNDPNFYKAQTILLLNHKKNMENFLRTGEFLRTSVYKFDKVIKKDECLWEVGIDFTVLLIVYIGLGILYVNRVGVNDRNRTIINEFKMEEEFLKRIFSSFIVSMDLTDKVAFKKDIINSFKVLLDDNLFLNELSRRYSLISISGKIDLDFKSVEKMVDFFLDKIINAITVFTTNDLNNMGYDNLDSVNDCKSSKQYIINHMVKKDVSKNDDRDLKLFTEVSKPYLNMEEQLFLDDNCATFEDLSKFFKEMNPSDNKIFRFKRLLDMHRGSIKYKSDLIKLEKDFDESEAVTQTRVLAGITMVKSEESKVSSDIVFDEDLESVLFGE